MPRELTLLSPAKINLTLAITGVREDGFHELVSLVAPVDFGDTLTVRLDPTASDDTLLCDFPGVPTDGSNLALKAVAAFRQTHPFPGGVHLVLDKRIPAGAGLGGGSSNASTVLLALNEMLGSPLSPEALRELSATLGSDCPLFLAREPVIMRGRGEQLQLLAPAAREALRGQRIFLFKPDFSIETAWAYRTMKSEQRWYCAPVEAEAQLSTWLNAPQESPIPLYNNMQGPAFEKFLALPALLETLRETHGVRCLMSGSGSACFAVLDHDHRPATLRETIRSCLGTGALAEEAHLL